MAAPLPLMVGLLVLVLIAWFTGQYLSTHLGRPTCTSPVTVEVAADPAIAPALTEVAATVNRTDGTDGPDASNGTNATPSRTPQACYRLQVVSQDAAAVADRLTGLEPGEQPDVWVPDSTFWLRRARAGGAIDLPEAGASLASSPVVMAVTEPAARGLGWPDRALSWTDVLGASPTASALTVGLPDPARSPVGLSTLVGVRAVTANGPEQAAAQVAALRRLSPHVTSKPADLFEGLPPASSTDPAAVVAFPASEQVLLRHDDTDPRRLVPVYAAPGVPALDYPYVVLSTTTGTERAGAERFLEALLSRAAQRSLQELRLRTPQGEAGADFPGTESDRPTLVPAVALPDQDTTDDVLRVWSGVNLSARILTVVDVSGSMAAQVPGTGLSRAQLTAVAAKQGLGLFKPTTDMGLWAFSDNLDGERDYRELAPIMPLSTSREHLAALFDEVVAMVGGKTNLYDTLLAAYQTELQGWDPARLNVVVVLTDGRDDDVSSISRQQLLDELAKLQDPKRPARMLFVGIGPDVDAAELDQIASITGGRAFTTPDPAGIRDVFAQALAEMTCIPPVCVKPR